MADYVTVARTSELEPGEMLRAFVNDVAVCIYNVDGEFYATQDTCTHAEASMSEGELIDDIVICPLHGSEFNVRTGEVVAGPATEPIATYRVEVKDGLITVRATE